MNGCSISKHDIGEKFGAALLMRFRSLGQHVEQGTIRTLNDCIGLGMESSRARFVYLAELC